MSVKDTISTVFAKLPFKALAEKIPSTIEDMPVLESGRRAFRGATGDAAPNNRDAITSVVVPNGVEAIGEDAFWSIDELTRVTLPDSIKLIDRGAFGWNPKLTSINLPAQIEGAVNVAVFVFALGQINLARMLLKWAET